MDDSLHQRFHFGLILIIVLTLCGNFPGLGHAAPSASTPAVVESLHDGSLLVGTFSESSPGGIVRRLMLNSDGTVNLTGEATSVGGLQNVIGAPDGLTALIAGAGQVFSVKIPGLVFTDDYRPGGGIVSILFNPARDLIYVMYDIAGNRQIDVVTYDSNTGELGDVPLWIISAGGSEGTTIGIERMAITPDGTKLYVTASFEVGTVNIYNATTGVPIGAINAPVNTVPREVCLSENGGIGMTVTREREAIIFDPTTDTLIGTVVTGNPGDEFLGSIHCTITADGTLGFVSDPFVGRVWVVDLTSSPPQLAGGQNPILTSHSGSENESGGTGDLAISLDQRFLLVTGRGFQIRYPLSTIDIMARQEINVFFFNGAPLVNEFLRVDQVFTALERSVPANDPHGLCPETDTNDRTTWRIFAINPVFTNTSKTVSLRGLQYVVRTLSEGNTLINADAAPPAGGEGSTVTIPDNILGPEGLLKPGESFHDTTNEGKATLFVCLASRNPFQFVIDVLGIAVQ